MMVAIGIDRRFIMIATIALLPLVVFLMLPGAISDKTHIALHGLCAQRPSHSLSFGGTALPMDARMTGIYTGALATMLWLLATRCWRRIQAPAGSVVVLLVGFVALMVLDGGNSLLIDLGVGPAYGPSNLLRLLTGLLAGTALAVALVHLFAMSIWARGEHRRAVVERPVELIPPLITGGVVGALALSGAPALYGPFAVGLMLAAISVFWVLSVSLVVLLSGRGWTFSGFVELAPVAAVALALAILIIGVLSGMRLAAESAFDLPRLT